MIPVRPESEAERLAARLPALLVAAERVAVTVEAGAHGRRRSGPGETFWQYRGHQPGDAATAVDWRQSARGQRLYVRETEWAAVQTVWLWSDTSPSMDWRSEDGLPVKRDRALVLALAVAALLLKAGERVGVAGPDGPRAGLSSAGQSLARLAGALLAAGAGGPPRAALLPRHGEAVLVSDFLMPLDEVAGQVRALAGAGIRGHLLQVLDPAEERLPFSGRVRFSGLEGEGDMLARRAEDLTDGYARRLAAHRDALAAMARAAGWSFAHHHTGQPAEAALLALYGRLGHGREGAGR